MREERHSRGGQRPGWLCVVGAGVVMMWMGSCGGGVGGKGGQLVIDGREYGRMYRAAKEVLRERGFVLEQQDYRYGLVSSRPRFSPTILEPWYSDNLRLGKAVESTLNQERRVVEVWLKPMGVPAAGEGEGERMGQGQEFLLDVQVWLERRQRPGRYLTGSMDAAGMVGYWRTEAGERPRGGWRRVGRDAALEEALRAEIVRRSVRLEEAGEEKGTVGEGEAQ